MTGLLRTLRFRLAAWCALVLLAVVLGAGGLLYGTVRLQLQRHHDDDLREAAASVTRILSEEADCERLTDAQRTRLDRIGHQVLFREVEGHRRVLYRSPEGPVVAVPAGAGAPVRPPDQPRFDTQGDSPTSLRTYSEAYRARSGRRGTIHVAGSVGDIVAPLRSMRLGLLLMTPLAVLASAIGGYWLAGRALAPVDHVTRLAREIEASNLSRRLPAARAPDEIGRLVATFNQMIARLEGSFEGMKRFTADASHELRGPLATMRGSIDVALARTRQGPDYREVLRSLGEDVDRLRSIVEDLLVLARADAGRMALDRSPVRLDVVAKEVVESFLPAAQEAGLGLSAECRHPVVVHGDERWLRQLVVNLVDNAAKFSSEVREPGSGWIKVEVDGTVKAVTLTVTDSGPGIPDEALDRIFERFYRADTARTYRGADGFGLGLSIAAWIVEAHAGTIAARNLEGGGSRFTVALPPMPEASSQPE